jgi:hypothetical protein
MASSGSPFSWAGLHRFLEERRDKYHMGVGPSRMLVATSIKFSVALFYPPLPASSILKIQDIQTHLFVCAATVPVVYSIFVSRLGSNKTS